MRTKDCVFLAADGLDMSQCRDLVSRVGDRIRGIKIHDLFDRYSSTAVLDIKRTSRGCLVWVDAKLHDIPKTVERRAKALRDCGADIITVHASGDVEMMQAALQPDLEVFAVTLLTSLGAEQSSHIYRSIPLQTVERLAQLAIEAGMHGIVCSSKEVKNVSLISLMLDSGETKLVVPGIRSAGKDVGDQKRVGTPVGTLRAGAHYLVMGRQITEADDPVAALDEIQAEIEEV